jgi:hypothetical protein
MIILDLIITGADRLPNAERADVYDAAASMFTHRSAGVCVELSRIATHLREAETQQLTFRNMLRAAISAPAD